MAKRAGLDLFDLDALNIWVGETIVERGLLYQRDGKVEELVLLNEDRIGAVVRGSRAYRVAVGFDADGVIESNCTCPYEFDCKHAVAAVLEYQHRTKNGQTVQLSADSRYNVLNWGHEAGLGGEDASRIENWLRGQSQDRLVDLLLGLCRNHPDIAADFIGGINLESGNTAELMREIRNQARSLIEGPDWEDDYGAPPDYSRLLKMMEDVLPLGLADELLDIMVNLFEAVQEQIEIYDHNGEFAAEAETCYSTAAGILRASSLDHTEKLLWAMDRILADQFDLSDSLELYLDEEHPPASWSEAADELLNRLQKAVGEKRVWERDQLSNLAVRALGRSGRGDEIIPLCEREAKLTKSYERLVRFLLEAGRTDDAERYIAEGVADTCKDLPGIASALRRLRTQMYSANKDWPRVLTHHICEFVASPSLADYGEVKKAAAKVKRWPLIRSLLLEYLQSGALPWKRAGWDLPAPDQVELARNDRWKKSFPKFEILIEIAILEKDLAEVAKWHDRLPKNERYGGGRLEMEVAEAVRQHEPERALAIWKRLAEAEIALTKPAAYQKAGAYLKKAGRLMSDLNRKPEWRDYLIGLKAANTRKSRLKDVLDALLK